MKCLQTERIILKKKRNYLKNYIKLIKNLKLKLKEACILMNACKEHKNQLQK